MAAGVHKELKQLDKVRRQLRLMGLRSGISPPRLSATQREQSHIFNKHDESADSIQQLKSKARTEWSGCYCLDIPNKGGRNYQCRNFHSVNFKIKGVILALYFFYFRFTFYSENNIAQLECGILFSSVKVGSL